MSAQFVSLNGSAHHGTAIIRTDDSVWVVVALKWWDLATRLWWWPHSPRKTPP